MPSKTIVLVGHTPVLNVQSIQLGPKHRGHRIFLLSPANISGERAKLLLRESAAFPLAQRLQSQGAPLGEVFSFISGLYFRGNRGDRKSTRLNSSHTVISYAVFCLKKKKKEKKNKKTYARAIHKSKRLSKR